ncbi:MAG: UDP-N-acetylmuramate dehydrogenase [Pyrinomonadaceae bacterium]
MKKPEALQHDVSLAPYATLGIGGPARYFLTARTEAEIIEALSFAEAGSINLFILGGGSNVLISDDGFDGLVLQIIPRGLSIEPMGGRTVHVTAMAGEDWDQFVAYCVENDLAGVECLTGIPGFVGGTPVQNVGAYGQEVSQTIVAVTCLDRSDRQAVMLSNADCGFSYRTSIFNSTEPSRYIVRSVTFALEQGGAPKVEYKDLMAIFGDGKPALGEVRDSVLGIRKAKSMVIDAADPNSRSAGSFFKNPVVTHAEFARLRETYSDMPHFQFDDAVKIPAAWLIEKVGFHQGFAMGRAGISNNHTLALINRGGATAGEIIALMRAIQAGVASKFGIDLQPEPIFVGFGER